MMASRELAILVALSWLASAIAGDLPPFVKCQTDPAYYHVNSTVISPKPNTFCFKVNVNVPKGCTDKCCKSALRKFELNVKPECRISGLRLSATLNGKPAPTNPVIGPAPGGANASVLRISSLGLDLSEADGAELCITLGTNAAGEGCLTLDALCVPPPNLGPGTCSTILWDDNFDCCPVDVVNNKKPTLNCKCNTTANITPFSVEPAYTIVPGTKTDKYCFILDTNPTYLPSTCSSVSVLNKIEIPTTGRNGAVKGFTLFPGNGGAPVFLSPSWADDALKITPIGWNTAAAEYGKVCVELAKGTTLESLCGGYCSLYLYNEKRDCCPSYTAGK